MVVKQVEKSFGRTKVLKGVDLAINPASSSSCSAPPDAGRRPCCVSSPGSRTRMPARCGSVSAASTALEPKERNVAMVFQSYALYPHMNVFNNQSFSLRLRRMPRAEIRERVDACRPHARSGEASRPFSARAVRRPAPARLDGPGDRALAEGLPVRRAAVQSRRAASRPHAERDQGAAPARSEPPRSM